MQRHFFQLVPINIELDIPLLLLTLFNMNLLPPITPFSLIVTLTTLCVIQHL